MFELIECKICHRNFKFLNNLHLRTHNISFKEYCKIYGVTKVVSANLSEELSRKAVLHARKPEVKIARSLGMTARMLKFNSDEMKVAKRTEKWMNSTGNTTAWKTKVSSWSKQFYSIPENIAAKKEAQKLIAKKLWENPNYVAKQMKALKFIKGEMNRLEQKFFDLCCNMGLPVEYVSYRYWKTTKLPDGTNKHMTPDFKVVGQNKIIEINGSYWHTPEQSEQREANWKSLGYDVLTIWDFELKEITQELRSKILSFSR